MKRKRIGVFLFRHCLHNYDYEIYVNAGIPGFIELCFIHGADTVVFTN